MVLGGSAKKVKGGKVDARNISRKIKRRMGYGGEEVNKGNTKKECVYASQKKNVCGGK